MRNYAMHACEFATWHAGVMDWDDVRVFSAVARSRSLSEGARAAGLDRSTASRRIANLERGLGARLFLRTRDGLRLSPLGDRLLEHAERMARDARALELSAAEEGGTATGRVRLATTEALARMLIRGGILDLAAAHPRLELELLAGNRPVDLVRGEADLALRLLPVREPSVRVRRVARLPFALFAGEAYAKRRGRPRSENELAGHDVLLFGGELATLPESKWLATRSGVRVALRTSSVIALATAASQGAGLAVLSSRFNDREPSLLRLFDVDAIPARSLWLAQHPDAAARVAVRIVADRVAAIVSETSP